MPIGNRGMIYMRHSIATALLSIASFAPAASADTTYYSQHPRYHRTVYRGRHHIRRTVRRVAVGAAGGAVIGAVVGGGPGAEGHPAALRAAKRSRTVGTAVRLRTCPMRCLFGSARWQGNPFLHNAS